MALSPSTMIWSTAEEQRKSSHRQVFNHIVSFVLVLQVKYSLSRQSDGNLIWYIYGEFASVEDYNKHASQQYEHVSLCCNPLECTALLNIFCLPTSAKQGFEGLRQGWRLGKLHHPVSLVSVAHSRPLMTHFLLLQDFYNGINELGIVWESHLLQPVLG